MMPRVSLLRRFFRRRGPRYEFTDYNNDVIVQIELPWWWRRERCANWIDTFCSKSGLKAEKALR